MPPLPPVTKALLLICTAVFCLQKLPLPLGGIGWFALQPLTSGRFMPWQVVTYAFLHADVLHLFFNMMGLWMFGAELEDMWGRRRFMQFLLASVLTGALAQVALSLVIDIGPTVGASGALYGLLLAFAMTFPERTIMPLFPPIPMKAKVFVAVFGTLELFNGVYGSTGVAHFAHLGGMLGGFLMLRYWRGQPPFGRGRRRY